MIAGLLVSVPTAQNAYIPNVQDHMVSVIDTATNTVTTTITLPETVRFPVGVAETPSGRRVYVTNTSEDGVPGGFGLSFWRLRHGLRD